MSDDIIYLTAAAYRDLAREDIPEVLADLARLQAELMLRLAAAPAAEGPDKLLKVDEVVERTGLRRGRVYELAREGRIPTVKVGHQVRFPERRLAAWIEEGGEGF